MQTSSHQHFPQLAPKPAHSHVLLVQLMSCAIEATVSATVTVGCQWQCGMQTQSVSLPGKSVDVRAQSLAVVAAISGVSESYY